MLLYFILGIVFITIGYPLMQNIASVFQAITQYTVYKYALKIYKIKKQMGVDQELTVQEQHNPIGFRSSVEAIGYEISSDQDQEED